MDVPRMLVVNAGLTAMFVGGALLLATALWWSWTGDGIEVPRERWPGIVRVAAVAGWALFAGGILVQIIGHVAHVGVARW